MVAESFFADVAPDGADLVQRLATAGYLPRGDNWRIGENLASANGAARDPAERHRGLDGEPGASGEHPEPRFGQIGVGVAPGSPTAATAGVTITTDFGTPDPARSRSRRPEPAVWPPHRGHRRDGRLRRPRGRLCRRTG